MNAFDPLHTFDEIRTQSASAVIAQSGISHEGLAAEIKRRFSSTDAGDGGLLQEPVIEAAPGYVEDAGTLQDLSGTLLHPDTIAALDGGERGRPGRYRFRREWHPYVHQVAAWRKLGEPGVANSVLVTSGTGSGKTECFLVPIIDDLVRQSGTGGLDEGVQAIVLYPLNALIASQEERLRDWTAPFGGRVRFALYNGLLPNEVGEREAQARPETVPDRASLRRSPPPILVTNVTMLEYMLLRPEDAPILTKSKGKLRYVVLDEAHSYIGAKAAEIALLLRRVCLAFGTDPKDVRFVATSATIGGSDAAAELARFLSDVSGASVDRVAVIQGKPHWPTLPPMTRTGALDPALMVDGGEDEVYDLLSAHRIVRPLLEKLRAGAVSLSEVGDVARKAELSTADLATGLSRARKHDVGLSPLRIHAFHRAVPGLWSCIDPGCKGPRPADWPFGAVHGDDGDRCRFCGGHTFEVVACNGCGEPYLDVVQTSDDALLRSRRARVDDEYAVDAEASADADDGEGGSDDDEESAAPASTRPRLILCRPHKGGRPLHVDVAEARACDSPSPDLRTFGFVERGKPDQCIACGARRKPDAPELIRSFRFGAPFLLGNLVPELLEGTAKAEIEAGREHAPPFEGHQLLSFTDSRQGTARISAKLQVAAERNFVRSFVYHAVRDALRKAPDTSSLDDQIATYERLIASTPSTASSLGGLLGTARAQRAAKLDEGAAGLPWTTMVQRLAERDEVRVWLREIWERRDRGRFDNPTVLANFLLLREFSRRPKQANSIETMGLARLRFDAIDAAKGPKAFHDLGGEDGDWRDYLTILQTLTVRGNTAVRMDWNDKRWIDHTTSLTTLVKRADVELTKGQRRWPWVPQGNKALGRPSRAVGLLLKGFALDHGDPMVRVALQECLDAAWTALRPILSPPGSVDHALEFTTASVAPVTRAHACPVTRRLLDASFRGLTPFGDWEPSSEPRKVASFDLARHPTPFLGAPEDRDRAEAQAEVAAWLAEEPTIRDLRGRGAWNNLTDRTAMFADYFRSAEHSAQQSPKRLRRYEASFKRGDINVLNCSTTMEMGVDIGSVSHVLMTNVPPSIASYRQRVGRAGRRRQAMSMAFTFCKDRPLDRLAFQEPIRFLGRTMRAPRVALDSAVIVQRHVNALLFSAFVHGRRNDAMKTQVGPFFGCPSGAGAEEIAENGAAHFVAFVRAPSTRESLEPQVVALTKGSALEGNLGVFDAAATGMEAVREAFAAEWRALQASRAKGRVGAGSEAANKGLVIRLKRMCEDYVLGVLSGRGFLPSHGFPTGVVSFVCRLDEHEEERADGGPRRMTSFPQRQLDVAIREYAPGAEVVLDGLVHRSAGVTLNWRRPANEEGVREIQNLLWRWECKGCGESGTTRTMDGVDACLSCGAADPVRFEYLEPAGFAADLWEAPHANPDIVSYVPSEEPRIALGGASWTSLANPSQGKRRESRGGTVFHCSSGVDRNGYEVCLHCGRAQEETDRKEGQAWEHKPLIGKADRDNGCTGSGNPFGVKRQLRLGYEVVTDVFEIQPTGMPSKGAGLAFAVALREALARRLGIGMEEMGVSAARRDKANGGPISSFVFDRAVGGSGFATQAGPLFDKLLKEMEDILDCKISGCVNGCPVCVLSTDLTDEQASILDRGGALGVTRRLAAEGAPAEADLAAPDARLTSDVIDSLARSRTSSASRLVLRIGSPLDVAALAEWRVTALMRRWKDAGGTVVVSAPTGSVSPLGGTALLALRDWLMTWRASLEEGADAVLPNGATVLAEVVRAEDSMILATRDASLLQPGAAWGQASTIPVVRFDSRGELLRGTPVLLDRLRPPPGAKIKTFENELNGSMRTFGKGLAEVMRAALREAGVPDGVISGITYSDRYLNSPVSARMAIDTLATLTGAAPGRSVKTKLEMQYLRSKDKWSTAFDDDWMKEGDRQEVMGQYAGRVGLQLSTAALRRIPHGRRLDIKYADGRSARIFMDQGFGAWEVQSPPAYPFNDTTQKQVASLIAADPRVVARGQTYIAVEAM